MTGTLLGFAGVCAAALLALLGVLRTGGAGAAASGLHLLVGELQEERTRLVDEVESRDRKIAELTARLAQLTADLAAVSAELTSVTAQLAAERARREREGQ
jgi:septal ring factor EnvC (AmiA/AmiB activator)